MKRPMYKSSLLLWLAICFLVAWIPVQGQEGDNLLINPGFEQPFVPFEGNPSGEVAEGWLPWWIPASPGSPSYQNRQPEYERISPDTDRILSGSDAQQVFSFFATHTGGVYQQVADITPGTTLRFSINAYVWSTTYDEVDTSEEDGDVLVEVGIDPTGGIDDANAAIVWSEPLDEQYDAYNEYSVEAVASDTIVTVFVRTTAGVPVKHNNIYLDDASLVVVGAPGVSTSTSTATVTATNTAAPTQTTEPTATPTLTSTPVPTIGIIATATATSDEQPLPVATETQTSTPVPSETPTNTPEASATPQPSSTPLPSETPTLPPSVTPQPSSTPLPSETPLPALTATATRPSPISDTFPYTVVHTVRSGETVAILAQRYDSSIQAITEANGLNSNYLIYVGQELIIPVRSPVVATPAATGTPIVIIVTATPGQPVPPIGVGNIYVVRPGDSLYRIARLFNTTIGALAQLNGIVNPNQIQIGQQLIIPGTSPTPVPTSIAPTLSAPTATPGPVTNQIYIVRFGDSLYRISFRYGVPIYRIAQANGITNPNLIYVGQRLVIP